MSEQWEILYQATANRDRAYARILELKALLKKAEEEHQKCIDKIRELHAEGA